MIDGGGGYNVVTADAGVTSLSFLNYERATQTSLGNAKFLHALSQQLRVPRDEGRLTLVPVVFNIDNGIYLMESLDLEELVRITGNDAFPGFTAPKLLWVREHEPEIYAKVRQVLINLIQNALDAMDCKASSKLSISIHDAGPVVRISVRDNGPGISEQDLVKVFDPFFTTKPVGSGTGLGLYISYGLATEQCKGDLSVRNYPQGGAEFTLSLPLENH